MANSLYWNPPTELTAREQRIAARAGKKRKLFVFLRQNRHLIFDLSFQDELCAMYRDTGAGKPPHPPARMAALVLLQAYANVADNEAIELCVDSKRWQMVLDTHDDDEPFCAQSVLYDFRMRLIGSGMDRRLLERTAQFADRRAGISKRALRLALDSSPLWGAGRVEDTVNLLAHASRKVIGCVAALTQQRVAEAVDAIGLSLFSEPSIKAALDVDWSDPDQKRDALQRLIDEIEALQSWIEQHMPGHSQQPPLEPALTTLRVLLDQDLEPDPDRPGRTRIKRGVARSRRISVEDEDMRHGAKSQRRLFNGFKRHIAHDVDSDVIWAAEATPANVADCEMLTVLIAQCRAANDNRALSELYVDRAYLSAAEVGPLLASGVEIVAKAPVASNGQGMFPKSMFTIDLDARVVTCPAGQTTPILASQVARFGRTQCGSCQLRDQCTRSPARQVQVHPQEELHQSLRAAQATPEGRARLRTRTCVEHSLAHVSQRMGNRARLNGTRKNTFSLRMACSIQNLERAQAAATAA